MDQPPATWLMLTPEVVRAYHLPERPAGPEGSGTRYWLVPRRYATRYLQWVDAPLAAHPPVGKPVEPVAAAQSRAQLSLWDDDDA